MIPIVCVTRVVEPIKTESRMEVARGLGDALLRGRRVAGLQVEEVLEARHFTLHNCTPTNG